MTGPHGIGKSQTCIKLNKALPDHLYVPSFAGPVAKRMGFDLNKPHTTQQLLAYQERVLETFIESYKATAFVNTIYDRSPNDIAAYFRTGLNGHSQDIVVRFEERCLEITRRYCDILIYPEADFSEPMANKPNRPTDKKYERRSFDKLLDYYATRVGNDVTVIDVPVEYQYDARVTFILDRLKQCPKTKLPPTLKPY